MSFEERLGASESVFRDINEGIERGQWPGEEDAQVGFRCECARLGYNDLLELNLHEYQRVRADPRRFTGVPGHGPGDVEVVVERRPGYLVVEKLDEAADATVERDPRGRSDPRD